MQVIRVISPHTLAAGLAVLPGPLAAQAVGTCENQRTRRDILAPISAGVFQPVRK